MLQGGIHKLINPCTNHYINNRDRKISRHFLKKIKNIFDDLDVCRITRLQGVK